uniref:PDXDC1/PDXD2 second domain-containing protein n=1 Tax=Pseudonaja textilis TaxID=8673 RepID=A0A670ZDE1_PSETE
SLSFPPPSLPSPLSLSLSLSSEVLPSLAAGLTSSQVVEKLRALSLWLSLQYLGHDGIVQRIKHASQLVRSANWFEFWVEDEFSSPVVVFKFSPEKSHIEQLAQLVPASGVDLVDLEDEGTCVRFSPLMTSAATDSCCRLPAKTSSQAPF